METKQTLALRIDLQRTQDRLLRARENGDRAAVMIAESRLRRLTVDLTAAIGLRGATGPSVPTTLER